ncbi:uncharacterized protein NEMAJ01_0769 [Nematocida major]|uniref:uncharacterized protein n=1 Tax=Nematocida major TaxID=1912982 RepID=UPI00200775C6|nr:uncharacterized protein NEMAJ01_0769 [Nematocida major]KAH9385873.1 hypothetical protein NEMAJ01_0769 [Nematocida major]
MCMEEVEKTCLTSIKKGEGEFSESLQKYKIGLLTGGSVTEHTDSVLGYFLLYLLAKGDARRYSLNRAEIAEFLEKGSFPVVGAIDRLWKASVLGDIPQMKEALSSLPETHFSVGEEACKFLQNREVSAQEDPSVQEGSRIEQIIKGSNMFFRV